MLKTWHAPGMLGPGAGKPECAQAVVTAYTEVVRGGNWNVGKSHP